MEKRGDAYKAYLTSVKAVITDEIKEGIEGAEGRLKMLEAISAAYNTIYPDGKLYIDDYTAERVEALAKAAGKTPARFLNDLLEDFAAKVNK